MSCWARTLTRARPAGRGTRDARADRSSSVGGGPLARDAAALQHVAAVGERRARRARSARPGRRRRPTRLISSSASKIERDQPGRDAERGLVEHQQARRAHERAADRDHLLLAARQRADELAAAIAQHGEERVDALEAFGLHGAARGARRRPARGSPPRSCCRTAAGPRAPAPGRARRSGAHAAGRDPRRPSGWCRPADAEARRWTSAACSCPRRWGRGARRSRRRRP